MTSITPPPPKSEEFTSKQQTNHQASGTTTGFAREGVRLTQLERIAVRGSEPAFNAFAGAVGGFNSGVITCPLDVIKTKLQAQGGFKSGAQNAQTGAKQVVYSGMLGTASTIWREEGLKGMYRGLGPIILGYLPTWAVWFTVYGKSKEYFGKKHGTLRILAGTVHQLTNYRKSACRQLLVLNSCGRLFDNGD